MLISQSCGIILWHDHASNVTEHVRSVWRGESSHEKGERERERFHMNECLVRQKRASNYLPNTRRHKEG